MPVPFDVEYKYAGKKASKKLLMEWIMKVLNSFSTFFLFSSNDPDFAHRYAVSKSSARQNIFYLTNPFKS